MHRKTIQIDAGRNIIAGDKTDAEFRQTQALRQPRYSARGGERVRRAEIAEDGDARTRRIRQNGFQQAFQHGFIARFGVSAALQLRECHGAFAQTFEKHRRRQAALDQAAHHRDGGVHPVTGKTGAITDQKKITHAKHSFEHFQAKWEHLATRKMRSNKKLERLP